MVGDGALVRLRLCERRRGGVEGTSGEGECGARWRLWPHVWGWTACANGGGLRCGAGRVWEGRVEGRSGRVSRWGR